MNKKEYTNEYMNEKVQNINYRRVKAEKHLILMSSINLRKEQEIHLTKVGN